MQSLLFPCRRCGTPIEANSFGATTRVLLDACCGACGTRALYEVPC